MDRNTTPVVGIIWDKELLTVREVAKHLRVSRVTVWRWCQNGFIPAFRLGRNWRIRSTDLSDFEETLAADYAEPKRLEASPVSSEDEQERQ